MCVLRGGAAHGVWHPKRKEERRPGRHDATVPLPKSAMFSVASCDHNVKRWTPFDELAPGHVGSGVGSGTATAAIAAAAAAVSNRTITGPHPPVQG